MQDFNELEKSPTMNIDAPVAGGLVFPGRGRGRHRRADEVADRLPFLTLIPKSFRGHFVAVCGEFVGTFLFLFFAFSGTQVANTQTQSPSATTISQAANPAQLLYIALCFGFSLAVNAWVFFRISGGLFNPVTLSKASTNAMPMADISKGSDIWDVSCRRPTIHSGCPPHRLPNPWSHLSSSGCERPVPGTVEREDSIEWRHIYRPRSFHRDVLDSSAGVHNFHACSRKAQGHFHRSYWHWTISLHC